MNFGHWVDHVGIVGKRKFCPCHLDLGGHDGLEVVITVVIIVARQWEVIGRFKVNTGNPVIRLTSSFRCLDSGTAVATNSGGVAPGGQRLERGVGIRRPSTRLSAPACSGDQQLKLTTALHCQMCGDPHLTNLCFLFWKPLNGASSRE